MPRLTVVTPAGDRREIEGPAGWSVMDIVKDNGFPEMPALCGGCLSCATCHVHVAPEWFDRLEPMGEDEDDLLAMVDDRDATSRLSCQIRFTDALDGLCVTIGAQDA